MAKSSDLHSNLLAERPPSPICIAFQPAFHSNLGSVLIYIPAYTRVYIGLQIYIQMRIQVYIYPWLCIPIFIVVFI